MRTPSVRPLRVLIANERMASACRKQGVLPAQVEIIPVAGDPQSCAANAGPGSKPDVILIDMAAAVQDGGKLIQGFIRSFPEVSILLHPGPRELPALDNEEVLATVMSFAAGRAGEISAARYSDTRPGTAAANQDKPFLRAVRGRPTDGTSREVTNREYEVLALLAAGYAMKEIAYRLGITYRTVTFHKYRMMERLGITTNAGLITYALQKTMNSHPTIAA